MFGKLVLAGAISLAVLGGVLLIFAATPETKAVRIGALIPLSGSAAIYGDSMRKGIELAAGEINSGGGINGRKLEIVYADSKGDAKEALASFRAFDNEVPAVITAISSVVLAVAPLAEKRRTILLNIGAKNPDISQAGDYVFSNIPNSGSDEQAFASFVRNELAIGSVATLSVNNDYGVGTSQAFSEFFKADGGIIVAAESYEGNAKDFRTQLIKIKNAGPEGIFVVGYEEQGLILKQARELGINATWLAPEGFAQPEIIRLAGGAAEGVIFHAPHFDQNSSPAARSFLEKWALANSKKPDIYAANAYDAVMLLADAISESGNDAERIKHWLYSVRGWPSVTGPSSFDGNGNVIKSIAIMTVADGEFRKLR